MQRRSCLVSSAVSSSSVPSKSAVVSSSSLATSNRRCRRNEPLSLLFQSSVRHKNANTRMNINSGVASKLKLGFDHSANMTGFPKQPEYPGNLDWASQDFLKDIAPEHLRNTFGDPYDNNDGLSTSRSLDGFPLSGEPGFDKHALKPFLRFTEGELRSFQMKKYPLSRKAAELRASSKESPSAGDESRFVIDSGLDNTTDWSSEMFDDSHSEVPFDGDAAKVSRELAYLRAWRNNVSRSTMADDLEVRLPNGQVISYSEYLSDLERSGLNAQGVKPGFRRPPELDERTAEEVGRVRKAVKERAMYLLLNDPTFAAVEETVTTAADEQDAREKGEKEEETRQAPSPDEASNLSKNRIRSRFSRNDVLAELFPELDMNPDQPDHLTMEDVASLDGGYYVRPRLDKLGRAYAHGKRKSCTAEVWLFPGDGQIFVNGLHYGQFFPHYCDRLNVSLPLLVCDVQRKVNVVATCRRGGQTGKSGAIRTAIAKALANYDPRFMPILDSYRLLMTDIRKHERKKPGKPRARKSEMWKKR